MLMGPINDERVNIGNITLHTIQWGEHGTPIICVHGVTANAFCFQALAESLARNHRVIAYDLRGRGDSDKPEHGYKVSIHAADLARLIDTLGLERPTVLGHSLGAVIALYFAAHYPEKLSKLILIDAGAPLPWNTSEDQPAWLTASISRLGTHVASFEEYVQRLKAAPFLARYWNDYLTAYFEHDVQHFPDGSVASKCYREGVLEESQNFNEAQYEQLWPEVRVPTLLLRAGQGMFLQNDHLLTEEAAAEAQHNIKNCRLVNFPTLNHYTIVFGVESGPADEIQAFLK